MLSAYFFNDGEIRVPSGVWEMGAEVRGLCNGVLPRNRQYGSG